ncbi:hypothetical protein E4U30_001591 [Claviceps sp. LM220 group G6]|nr:hypothetical protein E4U30_001591 [Claviceps sp. LM220 group G6]KAG6103722.1 hypothetical protein E4U31_002599 [Claviceps sp. LM219 group G6]KAG6122125.1 hypothetical protein E4U14_000138 [Claviceps sp. LM454 group G7]
MPCYVVAFVFERVVNDSWIILCLLLSIEGVGQECLFEDVGKVVGVFEAIGMDCPVQDST